MKPMPQRFQRATLLYNPHSGGSTRDRMEGLRRAAQALHERHIETELVATAAAGTAGEQARAAVASGSDLIFACGGDGTVHDILQGMVGSAAALGVIPLGTANALAWDLRLPRDPVAAALKQLSYTPRRISAGIIEFMAREGAPARRYFTVMAGAGPDAELVYDIAAWKTRAGILGYLLRAGLLYVTHHFSPFQAEFTDIASGARITAVTPSVMAVRITDFGNILRRFAPGAALANDHLRIVVLGNSPRLAFLAHLSAALTGYRGSVPAVRIYSTREIVCTPIDHRPARRIGAEADGEHLGRIPARISIAPDAFTLLMPD